jgi:hypothetical protein
MHERVANEHHSRPFVHSVPRSTRT